MAEFYLTVPGYAALLTRGGPDIFDNVGGLAWSDQLGYRSGTDVAFNGRTGIVHEFHFPFTIPIIFGASATYPYPQFPPGQPGAHSHASPQQRMRIMWVFVTFRTAAGTSVRVVRIRVFDRLATIFDTDATVGPLSLSSPTKWNNTTVTGENFHFINPAAIPPPAGLLVSNSIGVTVTVNFGPGGLINFTGAGIRLSSP